MLVMNSKTTKCYVTTGCLEIRWFRVIRGSASQIHPTDPELANWWRRGGGRSAYGGNVTLVFGAGAAEVDEGR